MEYSLYSFASVLNAKIIGKKNILFSSISVDSRTISNPDKSLFAALVTNRNDAHKYIQSLYEKGIRAFIVSDEKKNYEVFPDAGFLLVKNSLEALQKMAEVKRSRFKIPVIGVTGSNGKTVVKDWLAQLLAPEENICRSPKSYNSQIGVPLSVWNLNKGHTTAIFEAGISMPGEMQHLFEIIKPTHGIFTNLKAAHDENFTNRLSKAEEKLKLFTKCKKIFFCADHKEVVEVIKNSKVNEKGLVSWGKSNQKYHGLNTVLRVYKRIRNESRTTIIAQYKGKEIKLTIPFKDDASIENIMHCWLFLLERRYSNSKIQEKVLQLSPLEMRMELKRGINACTIINDSYSSDLESLSIALDFLNRQTKHGSKTVILSDIVESGVGQKELYRSVANLLTQKKINRVIGIGENISSHKSSFKGNKKFYQNIESFFSDYSSALFSNEAILIKGARKFQFEKIGVLLQEKSHDTVLEISLNAMVHNLNYYRSLLKREVKVMAMVKAFSYGSGSYEVANLLQHQGVNYLAVAYSDEGVELRKAGIKLPIMVMNPEEPSFSDLIEFNLEPELFSHGVLEKFIRFIRDRKVKKIPGCHIKLDTGMRRLGFEENDIDELIEKLAVNPRIKILSIFSHLVGSDNPKLDAFSKSQINLFKKLSLLITKNLKYRPLLHLCNSSGISRFKEAHFDMVRLGIGLYGVESTEEAKKNLMLAGTWKTKISQIKHLKIGDSVGYNKSHVVDKKTVIATVPVGYADGFSRRLSKGVGAMYIKNCPVQVIGNVCMDMCMLDITEVFKLETINEGEEVIIFDSAETLVKLSEKLETIPYEVLTSVSPRVKRVYTTE
ncbi:MAG: bifunctional UDP-N-acetylmuramoyl-tripeptide:D-alanyl-D-alanine ligase/alanine racemase [Bacteroidota bacterium]